MTSLLAQYNNNIASYEAITGQFQSMLSLLLLAMLGAGLLVGWRWLRAGLRLVWR